MYGEAIADEQLKDAQKSLADAEAELAEQQAELDENQQKIVDGQEEIDEAKADVQELDLPNYFFTQRNSNPGFGEFTSLSDRIDAIGNVFPVFFFLIGVLITFTTITRMIEENRKEIGTLKALGYRNIEIAQKYLLYACLTGTIGTVLGVVIGSKFIPPIVYSMLKKMYLFTHYPTHYWFWPILLAIGGAAIATLVSTGYILIRDLSEKPMSLLMPKAPKPGKRIFLEYITPLWRRLSFNQKVTYRNLFRYKARMILTILGIAGCAGLMVSGFGLNDSIGQVANVQFKQLNHYQAMISLDEEYTVSDAKEVQTLLEEEKAIQSSLPVHIDQMKFKEEGVVDQSATVYAFDATQEVSEYFTFNKRTKDSDVVLNDEGAIITKKLAEVYDANVGDTLSIQNSQGERITIKINGIIENYLGHNVFVTQNYLTKQAKEVYESNAILLKMADLSRTEEESLANKLYDTNQVAATTFISEQIAKQSLANTNLRPIILLFILLSGTLAFVVLFNLTNINVSERERELATIKVLGFFDKEVTMYIVRENVIFTIVGILLGFGIGKLLTWVIITMASSDLLSFPLIVPPIAYIVSAVMTVVFSVIVMGITHRKLKKIHMIEALKSNE